MRDITINTNNEEFDNFLEKISNLNKISYTHKIKFLEKEILFYTVLLTDNTTKKIKLCRYFILSKSEIFKNFPTSEIFTWTTIETNDLLNQLKLIDSDDFNILFHINDKNIVQSTEFNTNELEISAISGDNNEVKDLTIDIIKTKFNPLVSDWSIDIDNEKYSKVKKLCATEKLNKFIDIHVENNEVTFSQKSWKIKIGNTTHNNTKYSISTDNFNNILINKEGIKIYVYDSYIVVDEKKSFLYFNLELEY